MRSCKRFVQVVMNHIETHISRTGNAEQCIHIGTVHIEQAAVIMHHCCELQDLFFKKADGIRIGKHQCGNIAVKL